MSRLGGRDRLLDVLRASFRDVREDVALPMRLDGLEGLARVDVLAADDHRDRDPLVLHVAQPGLQVGALGCSRRIGEDRLVVVGRRFEEAMCVMAAILEWSQWPSSRRATPCPAGASARSGGRTGPRRARVPLRARGDGSGFDPLVERFQAFLRGEPVDFGDVEIDLDWATPLQRDIVERLRRVPRGEVVSYGELAALAVAEGPAAAGRCARTNRFSFIVPCHRVVGANGIGGYGDAGVEVKRRLLALEGVVL
jgi:methylated-DNA-[protein]-cysteine S-methyltransferase